MKVDFHIALVAEFRRVVAAARHDKGKATRWQEETPEILAEKQAMILASAIASLAQASGLALAAPSR